MPAKKSATKAHTVEHADLKTHSLEKEIKTLQDELANKQDKLLRAYADYQNYQKRIEKEQASLELDIRRRYLIEILDFYELLKKAADDPSPQEGLKSLLGTIDRFLSREGVKDLDCKGKPFDYKYHNALSALEQEECPEGTVLEEVKKGYLLGDTLLRPAQVIVSKKKD
jgi:molecular chaperone GrpE